MNISILKSGILKDKRKSKAFFQNLILFKNESSRVGPVLTDKKEICFFFRENYFILLLSSTVIVIYSFHDQIKAH